MITEKDFKKRIQDFYKNNKRDLPWRNTQNPYFIWVSEIMLQQTQAERVIPKFKEFIRQFNTPRALSKASLSDVLKVWQGLGYNSRAKRLHAASKIIVQEHDGVFPKNYEDALNLPGIGPYTAGAISVFSKNEPHTLIETNIRTVYIHFFLNNKKNVKDSEIVRLVEKTIDTRNPRRWFNALMDYGAMLKKEKGNKSRMSITYVKQTSFKGSRRELRATILRLVLFGKGMRKYTLYTKLKDRKKEEITSVIHDLMNEELITERRGNLYIKN